MEAWNKQQKTNYKIKDMKNKNMKQTQKQTLHFHYLVENKIRCFEEWIRVAFILGVI